MGVHSECECCWIVGVLAKVRCIDGFKGNAFVISFRSKFLLLRSRAVLLLLFLLPPHWDI